MDKPESTKSISEPTQSFVSPAVNDHVEATAGTNGAAPTGTPTDPAEFADEEYQDYEEEEYGEDMQYEEEEFGSGDTFEITASGESADFGEGFEGRVRLMAVFGFLSLKALYIAGRGYVGGCAYQNPGNGRGGGKITPTSVRQRKKRTTEHRTANGSWWR